MVGRSLRPKLFIASSSENLRIATAVHTRLENDAECTVWDQGTFKPSKISLQSLLAELLKNDFAVFIMAPDDVTDVRDIVKRTVRDNVIFELGMFIGRLGVDRCYMLVPSGIHDIHLPTDLLGITLIYYDADRPVSELLSAVSPACAKVLMAMHEHVGDESLSRLDLSGRWNTMFIEQIGRQCTIVEDALTAKQSGRKLTGEYENDDPERDTFSFSGDIAKDTVSGFYHIGPNVHSGAGTFQLRADETTEWLDGFCTWIGYPDGNIGHSRHIWFRPNSELSSKNRERALLVMREEIASRTRRRKSRKTVAYETNTDGISASV